MYNNTLTSTKKFSTSSFIQVEDVIYSQNTKNVTPSGASTIFDYGYIYSIELKRNEIKKQLQPYFECMGTNDELDFLAENTEILAILPGIGRHILLTLPDVQKLTLELLNEDRDWQTLFINIYSPLSWEDLNSFGDKFLLRLFELYPTISNKININLFPE
jgi:hypothetical protein